MTASEKVPYGLIQLIIACVVQPHQLSRHAVKGATACVSLSARFVHNLVFMTVYVN